MLCANINSFFSQIGKKFADFVKKSQNEEENNKREINMLSTEVIYNRLIKNEGIRLKPYKCPAGYLTIGVGRNLDLNPLTEEEKETIKDVSRGITKDQAFMLLRHDVDKVCDQLDNRLPWWRNLDSERQYVLIDMCFNMGINKLVGFKNTLSYLAQGNYDQAATNLMLSKYAKQVKQRAKRNADCIRTGKYEN